MDQQAAFAAAPDGFAELSGTWPPAGATPVDGADHYEALFATGYSYGPAFQGLGAVWRRGATRGRAWWR